MDILDLVVKLKSTEFMFWTLQNWAAGSVITLSPGSNQITFTPQMTASVDTTDTDFYEYSIFKFDGSPFKPNLVDTYREGSGFIVKPNVDTNDGIYHVRSNLVYKEHVLLFDNVSIFNDIIYCIRTVTLNDFASLNVFWRNESYAILSNFS